MTRPRFQLPPRPPAAVSGDRRVSAALAPANGNPFALLAAAKSPCSFDLAGLLAAQRSNLEAITAANRIVRDGVQAVVQRNLEILQQAIQGISESVQTAVTPEPPRDRAMRQTETAIKTYETVTASLRELSELIRHTNTEAMDVLDRRYSEAADEVKSLTRHATRMFWDNGA